LETADGVGGERPVGCHLDRVVLGRAGQLAGQGALVRPGDDETHRQPQAVAGAGKIPSSTRRAVAAAVSSS
jgi:hypothetical protein